MYADPDNPHTVRVNYTPSKRDREHLLAGAVAASRVAYTMGASVIDIFTPGMLPWYRPSIYQSQLGNSRSSTVPDEITTTQRSRTDTKTEDSDSASFSAWLTQIQNQAVSLLDPNTTRLGSAHQMSTCRMSGSRDQGVVDQNGKVWGVDGLWVADASVLPSATGVNPMVSVMGVSLGIAKGVGRGMRRDRQENEVN